MAGEGIRMGTKRRVYMTLLDKMKVQYTNKITMDRLIRKLARAVSKNPPCPKNVTEREIRIVGRISKGGLIWGEVKKKRPRRGQIQFRFIQIMQKGDPIEKLRVLSIAAKEFGPKARFTMANYICRAKKDKSLLGFTLTEEKNEMGLKVLIRESGNK